MQRLEQVWMGATAALAFIFNAPFGIIFAAIFGAHAAVHIEGGMSRIAILGYTVLGSVPASWLTSWALERGTLFGEDIGDTAARPIAAAIAFSLVYFRKPLLDLARRKISKAKETP